MSGRIFKILIAGLLLALPIIAQEPSPTPTPTPTPITTWEEPEFGELSEIRDAHKVYIFIEFDLEVRKLILKELAKDPLLRLVDRKEDAEFAIKYTESNVSTGISVIGSTVSDSIVKVGELIAFTRGHIDENNRRHQRILWSARKKQDFSGGFTLNRHPAVNAIREFLRDLKRARPKPKQ